MLIEIKQKTGAEDISPEKVAFLNEENIRVALNSLYPDENFEIKIINSRPVEAGVIPNEVVAGGSNELLKFLQWIYDQEELELTETGWYYKEDEEGTYELSNLEVLNEYYASQRKA